MRWILPALLLATMFGCDRDQPATTRLAPGRAVRSSTAPVIGKGIITGTVRLTGWNGPLVDNLPTLTKTRMNDKELVIPDESVMANAEGTLRNVLVYVKDAPASEVAANAPPVVLDQVNCRYTPHVLGLQVAQTLRVKSSDPTMHNVHMRTETNQAVNFGLAEPGHKDLSFTAPELAIKVKCDVHPWMLSYLNIFDHPFFAVSDEQGRYRIERLPAGTWTLVAWHERFGELEQTITVADDNPATVVFTYGPPPGQP